jgi:predicted NBD/HSP70 family sugar kinase
MQHLELLDFSSESGVNGRKLDNKKKIIRLLSKHKGALTIPEIAIFIDVSIPICASLIKDLGNGKLIKKQCKKISENGRRPFTYSLNKASFYVVGVEILSNFIQLGVFSVGLESVHVVTDRKFILSKDKACLEKITSFIETSLIGSDINKENIIGIGIGMVEVIKDAKGELSVNFGEESISMKEHLEAKINLTVVIDNDTRTIGVAEQALGVAKGVENVLIVKVSRTVGLSIIVDRHIVKGSHGVSGNINHVKFEKGKKLCHCGKIGCLGTEIGGNALLSDLKSAIMDDRISMYFNKEELFSYQYHDILDAVLKGDELAIELIQEQGYKLGKALGNIMNLLDPELVVIGGEYSMVKDFFIDAVKIGVRKTSLIGSVKRCKIKGSKLGRYFGAKAEACMLLKSSDMINF